MHPRVCLHQVGFLSEPTAAFIAFCREIGVQHMTLANPLMLGPTAFADTLAALAAGGPRAATMAERFARYPDLAQDRGGAAESLSRAIEAAAALGMAHVYLVTGGRGALDWEAAALRFAALVAPCRDVAAAHGIKLSVETANLLNADIHIAHTLDDTIRLAEMAGIGVTIDLGACWFEGGLAAKFARAMPLARLVQVSDYVLGDRSTPCRAVPGDGAVPLERLIGQLLALGYAGPFDIELTGPRIDAEGHRTAFRRAAENLSELLVKLGA
ncbi:MAG: TIM barrel protein [Novosphingobium sp.]